MICLPGFLVTRACGGNDEKASIGHTLAIVRYISHRAGITLREDDAYFLPVVYD